MRGDVQAMSAAAQQIINNPAHRDALERIEREIVKKIADTEFDGTLEKERYREKLNLLLHLQQRYKRILASMILSGRLEERELEQRKRFKAGGL